MDEKGNCEIVSGRTKNNNNNHHVVPLGILIVLCTVYIMFAGFFSNYYLTTSITTTPTTATSNNYRHGGVSLQPSCANRNILMNVMTTEITDDLDVDGALPNSKNKLVKPKPDASSQSKATKSAKPGEIKNKKDVTKKSNTAEPIIYLLALVFIYLLLKAASDINQHYKLKNKGDKRLRRCSLQSYAQAHKQDRRASKGHALNQSDYSDIRQKYKLLTEVRSISVDRYNYVLGEDNGNELLRNLRQPVPTPAPALLCDQVQSTTPLIIYRQAATEAHNLMRFSRRSSVPVNIASNSNPFAQLARRDSVIGTDINPMIESKRRVRMINRH